MVQKHISQYNDISVLKTIRMQLENFKWLMPKYNDKIFSNINTKYQYKAFSHILVNNICMRFKKINAFIHINEHFIR